MDNLPRHNSGRVFPLSAGAVRQSFTRLRLRAELPNIRFHDLRHEALSRYLENGVSIQDVQVLSGHKDVRVLMRVYANLRAKDIASKLNF